MEWLRCISRNKDEVRHIVLEARHHMWPQDTERALISAERYIPVALLLGAELYDTALYSRS